MSIGQNKIYYDVNIPYKAEEASAKNHYYSKAETEIRLNGPLITDPMNYDLAISKFKLDTECLPVFIPEMKHPTSSSDSVFMKTGEGISNYMVTAYFPKMLNPKLKYMWKRHYPVEWLKVPTVHIENEDVYEYKEEDEVKYYRGKIQVITDWTNIKTIKHAYDNKIFEYRYTVEPNKYRQLIQEPREWTPIPPGHEKDELFYEYWDYDGHNEYRRRLYENFTNAGEEDAWKDIGNRHIKDPNIFVYVKMDDQGKIEVGDTECRIKGIGENPINTTILDRDEHNYDYTEVATIKEGYGKIFYPENYSDIPEEHVRDNKRFEYQEAKTKEQYKAKNPEEEPQEWTDVDIAHVKDPDKYEYRTVITTPAKYRGRKITPQTWTDITDDEFKGKDESFFIYRNHYRGNIKGRRTTVDMNEFKNDCPEDFADEPEIYSYKYEETSKENNGHIFDSVSEYVTFCPTEGGPTTSNVMFRDNVPLSRTNYGGWVHPENTNSCYFQYDYQSVLDRINLAIERCLAKIAGFNAGKHPKEPLSYDETLMGAYFKLVNDKIRFFVRKEIVKKNILLKFSSNLYKYIGNGFKCVFYNNPNSTIDESKQDGSFFIDYNPFAWRHAQRLNPDGSIDDGDICTFNTITKYEMWDDTFFTQPYDYIFMLSSDSATSKLDDDERIYLIFDQQYSTLSNWNICKCILICSSSFPIKPEYYPTLNKNMTLTHYKEDWYVNLVQKVYNESAYADETQIFDKASTKILDVYYPLSSTGGDIRSSIIYSNENIEGGNKIDMVGGMDLENFDIKVKWVDLYGNVYDLYLAPGCSVNIRLCFTRKKLLKEELLNAFNQINSSLQIIAQSKIPTVDDNRTFDLIKEPPRKRNKVKLDGVLENGLIMKP